MSAHAWQDPINKRRLMMLFVYFHIQRRVGREEEQTKKGESTRVKMLTENIIIIK